LFSFLPSRLCPLHIVANGIILVWGNDNAEEYYVVAFMKYIQKALATGVFD